MKKSLKNQNMNLKRNSMKKKPFVIRHSGLLMISFLFILCGCMYFGMTHVSAKETVYQQDLDNQICYTSRLIEPGDSLWSIAEETMTDEYSSVNEYVEVLKSMNHLDSDTIHAGQYLTIAYKN